uniref:Putative metalloprotease n=1 Tax=Ixodes ricinus TaxID=34613 RepID=A0A0K8R2U7_IXORI
MNVLVRLQTEDCYIVKSKKALQAPGQLPGVGLSMTDLCKRLHPHIPGIIGTSTRIYDEVCKFVCYSTFKNSRRFFTHRLVDGMPCGKGRICFREKCGYYSTALPPLPTLPTTSATTTTTRPTYYYNYNAYGSN